MNRKDHSSETGTAVIELMMCMAFFLLPLLFGTAVMGFNLITSIEVTEFARDAAHLFSYGMDFSSASGQQMLNTLAGITITSGGNAVVIFSVVTPITLTDCTGAGFTASQCTNMGSLVSTRRIVVGNSSLLTSSYGTPTASIVNSTNGNVSIGTPGSPNTGYMNAPSAVVNNNFSITALPDGQYSYVAEVYVSTPALSWWGPLGITGVHSTFIF